MAALETELFDSGLPVEALMEKAALAVSRRLLARHGADLRRRGALVLVGPGHNGGDGLVIARELHLAGVAVRLWCPFERRKPLTERHRRHALWLGIAEPGGEPDPANDALWIDALLGIGQRQPPAEAIQTLLAERQRRRPGQLLAVDVPTGLCADTGRLTGAVAARACRTFSIGLIKTGLLQDSALAWVGRLERIELGLPAALLQGLPPRQPLALGAADLASGPWPELDDPAAGKYERGRLLLVAGSEAYRGAAHLALAGARASGCGSLRAALPGSIAEALWLAFPEVVLTRTLGCTGSGRLQLAGLQAADLDRLDAVLLGPGLGTDEAAAGSVDDPEAQAWQLLQRFPGLLVLDADGLNRLAVAGPEPGRAEGGGCRWLQGRGGPTWLTPHRGEFNRLFPDLSAAPALEAAAAAAGRCGVALLLKGARSVVAAADGRCWQLRSAEPRAARAGLGDVLAGFCAGLGAADLAAGGDADAATLALAALAHAEAARRAQLEGDGSPSGTAGHLHRRNRVCFYKQNLKGC
jgi:NAD(P)H-hydrate epimerase